MRTLFVCQRDPECGWATIAQGDTLKAAAEAVREKHHAKHDAKAALKAERKARRLTSATPAMGRGTKGSASPAPVSCACCARGLFGVHGVGHVLTAREKTEAA